MSNKPLVINLRSDLCAAFGLAPAKPSDASWINPSRHILAKDESGRVWVWTVVSGAPADCVIGDGRQVS